MTWKWVPYANLTSEEQEIVRGRFPDWSEDYLSVFEYRSLKQGITLRPNAERQKEIDALVNLRHETYKALLKQMPEYHYPVKKKAEDR